MIGFPDNEGYCDTRKLAAKRLTRGKRYALHTGMSTSGKAGWFFTLAGLLLRAKRHLRPRFARMTTWSGTQWTEHTKTCPQEINHCWCGSNLGKMHCWTSQKRMVVAPQIWMMDDDASGAKFSTHPQVIHFMYLHVGFSSCQGVLPGRSASLWVSSSRADFRHLAEMDLAEELWSPREFDAENDRTPPCVLGGEWLNMATVMFLLYIYIYIFYNFAYLLMMRKGLRGPAGLQIDINRLTFFLR